MGTAMKKRIRVNFIDHHSFVVSNDEGDPMRIEFFHRLSKYKPVASGGKLFNNVGGRVLDKNAFVAQYKFNIAFENSCVPGYTTEKILEPLAVHSVPIYYGNPAIAADFNPSCMVHVANRGDVERAGEEIIALDRDDAACLRKLSAPARLVKRVKAKIRGKRAEGSLEDFTKIAL